MRVLFPVLVSIGLLISMLFTNLLLVDDDGSDSIYGDVKDYYIDALDANGYGYTYYSVDYDSSGPDITTLNDYSSVIWFTGEMFQNGTSYGYTLTNTDEVYLEDYLTTYTGNLLFVSQDYITSKYGAGNVNFSSGNFEYDILKLNSVDADHDWGGDLGTAYGEGGTVADGLTFTVSTPGEYNIRSVMPDLLDHSATTCIYHGSSSTPSCLQYDGGYMLVYLTTPFEALGDESNRNTLMDNIMDFFGEDNVIQDTSFGAIKMLFE